VRRTALTSGTRAVIHAAAWKGPRQEWCRIARWGRVAGIRVPRARFSPAHPLYVGAEWAHDGRSCTTLPASPRNWLMWWSSSTFFFLPNPCA
jgi:hypothetical protein